MKTSSPLSRTGLIVCVLTSAVLLAGCKQVGQQVQTKVAETVSQAQTALLSESDLAGIKDPLVRKNFVAQANAHAYRIVTTSSGKNQGSTTTEIQVSGSDVRFHTMMQVAGKTQEMIVMGDTTYVKDPTGTWWKQVNKPDASQTNTNPAFKVPTTDEIKQEFTKKQDNTVFTQLGTEGCGTLTCYKYQEIDNGNTAGGRTFWFDNQEFLTRKDEQKFGDTTTTNVYSYDSVNITAPSPTQDVPEGHSAFEYMMGVPAASGGSSTGSVKMPSKAEIDALMKQAQDTQK